MSAPSLGKFIVQRPWLHRWVKPIANWYMDAAGYRKLGLRYDDLIPEESDVVQKALKRLPPKEAYDRIFRIRRAFQCSVSHTLLSPSEHTKPEDDIPYLSPIIEAIEKENAERQDLDNLTVKKR
ncbi:cytochrome b-c1 complex subunit 7 [Aspergillus egyptiacus]|nr:cytochrome b-c1 complex subunit 7 [Aspergillus egyptiacus]